MLQLKVFNNESTVANCVLLILSLSSGKLQLKLPFLLYTCWQIKKAKASSFYKANLGGHHQLTTHFRKIFLEAM
jgi:hypothetical protein